MNIIHPLVVKRIEIPSFEFSLDLTCYHRILRVGVHAASPTLWVLDSATESVATHRVNFFIVGTGEEFSGLPLRSSGVGYEEYIGSFPEPSDQTLILHVFYGTRLSVLHGATPK